MQRSKWLALVLLIGVFIAGGAIGVAADRAIEHRHGHHGPPGSQLDRMARELDLTAAQRAQFDTILEKRRTQMRTLFAPIRPQMDSLMALGKVIGDSTHQQLRRILNPDQQAKFDKLHQEAMKRGDEARRRFDRGNTPEKK
jgi:Spy/CpxP family protein refolding chaperone